MAEKARNLWHLAKPIAELKPLCETLHADVAIVGAGYTGLSCALHLAQQGKHVVVLEAHDVGYGASGRNVGLTNAGLWIMPEDAVRSMGVTQGQRINQFLIDSPRYVDQLIAAHKIDCDYTRNGTLHLAHNARAMKYLSARRGQLAAYGADVELLDKDVTYELTRAENYHGALKDSRAGTLQPLKYCLGLARAALKSGVQIYNHSAVLDIEQSVAGAGDKGGKMQLKTQYGHIIANDIILATNAYEEKLSHNKSLYTSLYYCQLASKILSEVQREQCLPANMGVWDSGAVMRSFRTDAEGRLLVGTVGNIHTASADGFKKWSRHVVAKTFPHIGELKYEYAWAGRIAKSANNIPQIQEVHKGVYQIVGYSGRGIAPATVTGKLMADYLCKNISADELPLPFNVAKHINFNRVRAAIYEIGCQLSHISDFIVR
ncbi:MAG: FAD-dependent oxidoreductase [Hyphomicrobiales bacterium]|nr:MAG: FAD-dependent oxidoreductase [Hyphomicrobiales bacterium]